jgi:hypothetical protein
MLSTAPYTKEENFPIPVIIYEHDDVRGLSVDLRVLYGLVKRGVCRLALNASALIEFIMIGE